MLKILLLSGSNSQNAGKVTYEMKDRLENIGNKVTIFPEINTKINQNDITFWAKFNKICKKVLKRTFHATKKDYYFFDYNDQKTFLKCEEYNELQNEIDLILVSFYANFLSTTDILNIQKRNKCPIVFWLHDMVTFTGGCHYSNNCYKYETECRDCPAIIFPFNKNQAKKNFYNKLNNFSKITGLYCWAISSKAKEQVEKSKLLGNTKTHVLFHAIDENRYYFKNEFEIKKNYETKNILFIATDLSEKRKGFEYFYNLMNKLYEDNIRFRCIIVGRNFKDQSEVVFPYEYFETLTDDQIAELYRKSFLFICTSIADSGPLTLSQAVATMTPTVSFDIGIAKDIINNNISGFVVNDEKELFTKVSQMLKIDFTEYKKMCYETKNIYLNKISNKKQEEKLREIIFEIESNIKKNNKII